MRLIRVLAIWTTAVVVAGLVLWNLTPSRRAEPDAARSETSAVTDEASLALAGEPIQPLPRTVSIDRAKASLGKKLFHDAGLSRDGDLSCASCHDLSKGGADGMAKSKGTGGETPVNTPTVFNTSFNFKQFWDGRAGSLEEQVDGPLLGENEMAASWDKVLARLRSDPSYVEAFESIYPDGITIETTRDALVSFEMALVTPDSRFDRYLRGDRTAITPEEEAGYTLFKDIGCVTCHQGVNVGGNMFQTFGKMGDYFTDRGNVQPADYGRFNVTGLERDRFKFKVPGLRNVALTAPYFHDAQAATLDEAVQVMARYQLGYDLPGEETTQLVAFLNTLTGEYVDIP